VMRQASSRATKSNLTDLALGNEKRMREAIADPTDLLVSVILPQAMSQAKMWESQGKDPAQAFRLALSQASGMKGPELEVLMQNVMGLDKSLGERSQGMIRQLGSDITDRAIEDRSVFARMGRSVERFFEPAGKDVAGAARWVGDAFANQAGDISDSVRGLTNLSTRASDINFDSLSELADRGGGVSSQLDETTAELKKVDEEIGKLRALGTSDSTRGQMYDLESKREALKKKRDQIEMSDPSIKVSDGLRDAATKVVKSVTSQISGDIDAKVRKIKDTEDPDERRKLVGELLNDVTAGQYADSSPKFKKAIQAEVLRKYGISSSDQYGERAGSSKNDRHEVKAALNRIAGDLGVSNDEARTLAREDGFMEYVQAVADGEGGVVLGELQEKLEGGRLTPRDFQRINELSPEKVKRLLDDAKRFNKSSKDEHVNVATVATGDAVGSILSELGIEEGRALQSGDAESVIETLGSMTLTPEKMAALKKKDSRLASVLENITEGAVGEQQEKIIRGLINDDDSYDKAVGPDGIIGDNVGKLRAMALIGHGFGDNDIKMGEGGIATEEAKKMYDVTRMTVDLAIHVKDITRMLAELKGRP